MSKPPIPPQTETIESPKPSKSAEAPSPLLADFLNFSLSEMTQLLGRRPEQKAASGEPPRTLLTAEKQPLAKIGLTPGNGMSSFEVSLKTNGPANQIEDKYGISVDHVGHRYDYRIRNSGRDTTIFSTEATTEGLQQADHRLSDLVADKEKFLTTTYGVRFSQPGEFASTIYQPNVKLAVREPTLPELDGVEAAIKRSVPSQKLSFDQNGEGIKFYFLTKSVLPNASAYVTTDRNGQRAVFVQPDFEMPSQKDHGDTKSVLEAELTHELAHNMQNKLGWNSNPAYHAAMLNALGWKTDSVIEDSHGNYYSHPANNWSNWYRSDANGRFDAAHSQKISNDQMEHIAKVRPISPYFPAAGEMFADGIRAYRLSEAHRQELLEQSPRLYGVIKQADQTELDRTYGQSRMIRLPGGKIVQNTDPNRQLVARFEAGPSPT